MARDHRREAPDEFDWAGNWSGAPYQTVTAP
jgi:hypothetical protein